MNGAKGGHGSASGVGGIPGRRSIAMLGRTLGIFSAGNGGSPTLRWEKTDVECL